MKSLSTLVVLGLTALTAAGCGAGSALPPPADPQLAGQSLSRVLDAWVQGKNPDDLKSESPSLVVADFEWKNGAKLKQYQIEGAGQQYGAGQRFEVMLTYDAPNVAKTIKAVYRVGTGSPLTVIREDGNDD